MTTAVSPQSRLDSRAPTTAPPRVDVAVRRRRVLTALAAAGGLSLVVGFAPGMRAAWWTTLAVAVLAAAYVALLSHLRNMAARREWDLAHAAPVEGWSWEEWETRLADAGSDAVVSAAPTATLGRWALARFAVAYATGWVLTPLIVVLEQIAGGAAADSRRRRWLQNLIHLRAYGRQQSVKALSLSIVATAGVASIGPLAATASAAGMPATGVQAAAPGRYTVQAGDTLGRIAARFGTTVSALASANAISNPNLIFAGQVLTISGGSTSPSSSAGGTYTVKPGDTLGAVAARFGTTVSALAAANGISNPNMIFAGQVLHLGGGGSAPTPAPVASAAAAGTYTVQPGDTLGAIAARFGTTVSALASANGISNPNMIFAGQVLHLGGGGSAPAPDPAPAPARTTVAPAPSAAPAAPSAAAVAVRVALQQVGKPYQWGGAGPASFDCSGLVMYAYAAAGVSLPHYTVSQYDDTARITEGQLQPGDLVFYDTGAGAQPGHVAIYIGNGQVVAANTYGTLVQTQSLGYDGTIMGFGRV